MGVLTKVNETFKLDKHGLAGVWISLWVNFPYAILKEYWAIPSDEAAVDFILERGLFSASSFTDKAGAPVPFAELPWDVQLVATRELMEHLVARQRQVFHVEKPEGAPAAEAPKPESAEPAEAPKEG